MTLTEGLQRPMTLVLPLADPSQSGINALGRALSAVSLGSLLDDGGMVHFARFVIVGGDLLMVSSYDGEFEDYILQFVRTMGSVFDTILGFVVDPAPTPTAEHPYEFVAWVQAHDQPSIGFYSGYPGVSTQQVRAAFGLGQGAASADTANVPSAEVDWADVQGLVVRGFGMRHVCHLCLHVVDAAGARAFLGRLVDGGELPQLTDATPRAAKPRHCLALGATATGLTALGVIASSLAGFETAFVQGAAVRARRVGDVGLSAPELWVDGLGDPDRLHLVASLYASSQHDLDAGTTALRAALGEALEVIRSFEGSCLKAGKDVVHFGYRDNISQPTLAGAPGPPPPSDDQAAIPPGELFLGYPSQFPGVTLEVPQPDALGRNGSFAAFRVLRQDTAGFARFLETQAAATGLDVELLAAKIVGRWRSGEPLVRCPDAPGPLPRDQWNDYGYLDDPDGLACPMGAHMRRANPRDLPMHPVGDSSRRRIVRRGIPYGPDVDPDDLDDGIERGLLGLFIGASLTMQIETVLGEWLNEGLTDVRVTGTNDPLIGANGDSGGTLTIPRADGDVTVKGFGEFVTTRAAAYLFLPSLTAVRWLAALGDP
jgi:deferrochelatase/peroxidase EfeB